MKYFLKSVALFVLLVVSIVATLIFLSDCAVRSRKQSFLKVDDNIKFVFSGDSHVECSVNDELIDHSINIAQSGEAYLYSYAKIRSLLECNDQIKTVFIGFSYGDLLKDKEISWLFGKISVAEYIKNYNYILSGSDKSLIFKHNPKAYVKGLAKSVFPNSTAFIRSLSPEESGNSRLSNYGGYMYLLRDKLQEDIEMIDTYRQEPLVVSHVQEQYLMMLSQLCRQKSVRLILLNTPKYPLYNENVNQEIRQNWISFREKLQGDSLLDFSEMVLPDSCFGDMTHLNYRGAELFSLNLNDLLK